MIGFLQGTVAQSDDNSLLIISYDIGFEAFVPHGNSFKKGSKIALHIHVHWNQENGPTLFGFQTYEEKKLFLMIIKCPGIGPKIALAMIEHLGAQQLIEALSAENIQVLSSIPGIGKKKAEQLSVQLKHKVSKLVQEGTFLGSSKMADLQKVSEVLNSLNYSRNEISNALEFVRKKEIENITFDLLLRQALSYLSKKA